MPLPETTPGTPTEVSVREVQAALAADPSAFVLLDVREPWEIATAALPGAVPLDEAAVQGLLAGADRSTPLVFSCHHGVRSYQAAAFFAAQGFARVYSMAGGIDAWSLEIDPGIPRY